MLNCSLYPSHKVKNCPKILANFENKDNKIGK